MWETMTNKISFLMKSMSKELGRSDLKISQVAAHCLSTLDRNNLNLNQTSTDQAKEHLNYISEIAKFLDKTPKDIENLENEVSSAEDKIRALNRASSAAIGYGAGKKTGM